jgi:hypothetical protein
MDFTCLYSYKSFASQNEEVQSRLVVECVRFAYKAMGHGTFSSQKYLLSDLTTLWGIVT